MVEGSIRRIFDESTEHGNINCGSSKRERYFEEATQEDGRKNSSQREHLLGKHRTLLDELQRRYAEEDDDNLVDTSRKDVVVVEEEERT